MDSFDRKLAEKRERFGRDYLSASHGAEIPLDNMDELLENAEQDAEDERPRTVLLVSGSSFQAEVKTPQLKAGRGNTTQLC